MWTCEHAVTTNATPAQVWARYADPRTWPEWDAATERVTLQGPLAVGSRGTLKAVGGPTTRFTLTEVVPETGFTTVTRLPLARLVFRHQIEATATGSHLTHAVTISGPLSSLFGRVIGTSLARDLPGAMNALARLAAGLPVAAPP